MAAPPFLVRRTRSQIAAQFVRSCHDPLVWPLTDQVVAAPSVLYQPCRILCRSAPAAGVVAAVAAEQRRRLGTSSWHKQCQQLCRHRPRWRRSRWQRSGSRTDSPRHSWPCRCRPGGQQRQRGHHQQHAHELGRRRGGSWRCQKAAAGFFVCSSGRHRARPGKQEAAGPC